MSMSTIDLPSEVAENPPMAVRKGGRKARLCARHIGWSCNANPPMPHGDRRAVL